MLRKGQNAEQERLRSCESHPPLSSLLVVRRYRLVEVSSQKFPTIIMKDCYLEVTPLYLIYVGFELKRSSVILLVFTNKGT